MSPSALVSPAAVATYPVDLCPLCRIREPRTEVTGKVDKHLFAWQQGRDTIADGPQNAPRFHPSLDGHDEAELRCLHCAGNFWSFHPKAIEEALEKQEGGGA